jgi:glycosyltransferase involved in cell wall biosynthesis
MHELDAAKNVDVTSCHSTVTVVLCTYNRCQSLANALQSVSASEMPSSIAWEVLVVDNNSTDQTREVVEGFARRHPGRFRYLFEPTPGKSHALNAGIRDAHGDILAFIDDDVTVEKNWLRNLTGVLVGNAWAGSGGRILPEKTLSPPPWLPLDGPDNMGGILALFDLGDESIELSQPPFGTNMAFQKTMFEKHGGFRLDLGPRPGSELRNEDTEFGRRLLSAGERLRYEPSAKVYHRVPEERLTTGYFLKFCFDHGRASIREAGRRPNLWGVPRHYLTLLKVGTLFAARSLRWIGTCWNRKLRFYRKAMVWMTAGEIAELRSQPHQESKQTGHAVPDVERQLHPRT